MDQLDESAKRRMGALVDVNEMLDIALEALEEIASHSLCAISRGKSRMAMDAIRMLEDGHKPLKTADPNLCNWCNGFGRIETKDSAFSEGIRTVPCRICQGKGHMNESKSCDF